MGFNLILTPNPFKAKAIPKSALRPPFVLALVLKVFIGTVALTSGIFSLALQGRGRWQFVSRGRGICNNS